MSDGMNKVILLGNLGADPDLRYTAAGTAVLHLRLATNDAYYDRKNELQERTDWHSVSVFGNRAEALARILKKGSSILVDGALRVSSYEKDGQKRVRVEVVARDICLTSRRAPSAAAPPPEAFEASDDGAVDESLAAADVKGEGGPRGPKKANGQPSNAGVEAMGDLPF